MHRVIVCELETIDFALSAKLCIYLPNVARAKCIALGF